MAYNISPAHMSYPAHSPWASSSSRRPSISTTVPPPYSSAQSFYKSTRGASEIIPGLYISDLSFAETPSSLTSYGITHVLSTLSSSVILPSAAALHPFPQPRHLHVRIEDLPFAELAAHLPTTTAWIRDALRAQPNARVLVHCAEGVSRSVAVVAGFLVAQYGWTPTEAVQYIKSKRRVADPNFGFVQQLGEYARSIGVARS
ncbi:hypothetical protein H0H81_006381 [Sphagnurus paluster]|uniref:protein-tyrosine-phosphatase n=1 Tax=Sphagnurus paluster TaxID=117069 RepID=A0A9P7K594_9AGAR|nr:hypothetical protein H0H81_006381 [Sphagnurus paluster]